MLIVMERGGLLPQLFGLGWELVAPDLILEELREGDRQRLEAMGLGQEVLTPDELVQVRALATQERRLSVPDCAAFIAARERGMMLLAGDGPLRRFAEGHGIKVHGTLWLMDEMEAVGLLNGLELAVALRQMLARGARLPDDECESRLRRWEAGGK
ncbi:MAG: hypothetical protein ACRDHL_12685 [Candidatus Promineifilaceae bacterium]